MINDNAKYLDYAASTPLDPEVLDTMLPFMRTPGNAHSRYHPYGGRAAQAVETARGQIAAAIGAKPEQIVFTSGATEANNLAFKGLAKHLKASGKTHIVTGAIEHKSVLEPLKALEKGGFRVTIIPPKPCGMIEGFMVEKVLEADTGLVSVQAVNNELGTIQPLSEIAEVLEEKDILFHTDAAQALGKIEVSLDAMGVDFMSLSAHKVYGPQGIGALYMRDELIEPLLNGGGQEKGLRSGTIPAALCVGFGHACTLIKDDSARLQEMRDMFLAKTEHLHPVINGHSDPAWNVPGILNLRFPGIDNETLVMMLPGLAFGTGSACSGQSNALSHVITAIGSEQVARESVRLSFGRFTTTQDMEQAAEQIITAVTNIKQLQEAA